MAKSQETAREPAPAKTSPPASGKWLSRLKALAVYGIPIIVGPALTVVAMVFTPTAVKTVIPGLTSPLFRGFLLYFGIPFTALVTAAVLPQYELSTLSAKRKSPSTPGGNERGEGSPSEAILGPRVPDGVGTKTKTSGAEKSPQNSGTAVLGGGDEDTIIRENTDGEREAMIVGETMDEYYCSTEWVPVEEWE